MKSWIVSCDSHNLVWHFENYSMVLQTWICRYLFYVRHPCNFKGHYVNRNLIVVRVCDSVYADMWYCIKKLCIKNVVWVILSQHMVCVFFFSPPLMCYKSSQLWCFYFHTLMQFHNLCPMNYMSLCIKW